GPPLATAKGSPDGVRPRVYRSAASLSRVSACVWPLPLPPPSSLLVSVSSVLVAGCPSRDLCPLRVSRSRPSLAFPQKRSTSAARRAPYFSTAGCCAPTRRLTVSSGVSPARLQAPTTAAKSALRSPVSRA